MNIKETNKPDPTNGEEKMREWKTLFDEIDVERREYTPDQGMPSPIYEVNSAQMDYVVSNLLHHSHLALLEQIVDIGSNQFQCAACILGSDDMHNQVCEFIKYTDLRTKIEELKKQGGIVN